MAQQLCGARQQKTQTVQQLHDMRQQKEKQIHKMRQLKEELTKMKLKNKSLKHELNEMLQKTDVAQITQTANFIDYNPKDFSVSRNSSDDEKEIIND